MIDIFKSELPLFKLYYFRELFNVFFTHLIQVMIVHLQNKFYCFISLMD